MNTARGAVVAAVRFADRPMHGLARAARRAVGLAVVALGLFIAGQAATTPATAHAAPAQPWRLGVVGHAR